MKKGIVVYGFPCIGKSTLCDKENGNKYLDLESSDFQWVFTEEMKKMSVEERKGIVKQKNPDWPANYAKAITEAREKYDFIFVARGRTPFMKSNKLYEIIIPRNVRLAEAPSHGKPVMLHDPKCVGARAYKALTEEFLSHQR